MTKRSFVYRGLLFAALAGGCGITPRQEVFAADDANILKNPGFEEGSTPVPQSWMFESKAAPKGSSGYSQVKVHAGQKALQLTPNQNNSQRGIANAPLGVGQGFPSKYFLGKRLYVSAWMSADGSATAVVGLYALKRNGSVEAVELRQSASPGLAYREDSLNVSNDKNIQFLILNCHVEGQSGAAYFDDIYVGFDPPPATSAGRQPQQPLTATLVVEGGRDLHRIPPAIYGTNVEWIWDGNGLWDSARNALDPSLVQLVRDLSPAQIRFPGGIFADFYRWRDGTGPQAARKTTESMPGGTQSRHSFGTDEALDLSRQVNSPLFLTANIVTGTPTEAVEWLRYIRDRAAATGAPPVTHWELGNEPYVKDGSPHSRAGTMTPGEYVRRFRQFASALRAADRNVKIGAIVDENFSTAIPHAYPSWTEEVLREIAGEADFVSTHNAYAPAVIDPGSRSAREIYGAMLAAPVLIERNLADLSAKIARHDPANRVKIAITEWGPFFHLTPASPYVDHVKTLGSALYVASVLKAFAVSPQVESAHFFKLADKLFMGWIGPRQNRWTPKAPYLALQMFRRHFGEILVESAAASPVYDSRAAGWVTAVPRTPFVEAIATRSADGRKYFVLAINKHFDADIPLDINLKNLRLAGTAVAWTLGGTGLDAHTGTELFQAPGINWAKQATDEKNPRFEKGGPDEVKVTSRAVNGVRTQFQYLLPKASVTSLEIDVRP